jgi:hypothetical protein
MAKSKLPVEKLKASKKPIPVKIVSDYDGPSPISIKSERHWRAEDALRDIERAETHRRDKALMADVKKLASDKVASLKKIC